MFRILWTVGLLFIVSVSLGQGNINPFEIKSRQKKTEAATQQQPSSTQNVFDIEGRNPITPETDTAPIPNPEKTKEEQISTIIPPVGEDTIEEPFVESKEVNPFDVSHVPIRKSKLKKEANAFTTKTTKKSPKTGSNAFLFWLLLATGLILAIVINTQRGAITKITKAITNENVLKLNQREEQKGVNGHYLLLYLSFFINAGIFLYLVQYHYTGVHGWKIFQRSFIAIAGIYLLRHLFLYGISKIFPIEKEASLYSFTIQSFNLFLGIIMIPINLIIAFGPENTAKPMIYLMGIVVGGIYILRNLRGILVGSKFISGNLFHFLLYLCAFEILPILILLKIVVNFGTA